MLRRLLPAVLLLVPVAPARAEAGAYTFFATAEVGCFGCGISMAHGSGTFTGVVGSHAFVRAPLTMSFTVYEPEGTTCVVSGSASGTVQVDDGVANVSFSFNWTRVDVRVVATTFYDVNGVFAGTFVPTSPVDLPCGHPVAFDLRVAGFGT